jgi:C1A family cysteine protease
MSSTQHKYKLKKQKVDHRDFKFRATVAATLLALPTSVDLRPEMPPVLDQGPLGSCGAHAVANALHYLLHKEGIMEFTPSRLFLYYNTRVKIETIPPHEDSGVTLRDMCIALSKWRACNEELCPYVIEDFWKCPTKAAYAEAKTHTSLSYFAVAQNQRTIKTALAEGFPVVFGMMLFDSFVSDEVAETGQVPLPDEYNENLLGGHALKIVGHDDATKCFTVMNSWSQSWGHEGYCYIPYAYVLNPDLAWDFWVIKVFK